MTTAKLQNLNAYLSVMAFARRLYDHGLMSREEYRRIEQITADDFLLPDGSLYRERWLEIA